MAKRLAPSRSPLRPGVIALSAALAVLAPPSGASDSTGWVFSGRYGVEVDGLVERFGSDSVIDGRLDPASPGNDPGTIEDALLSTRYRSGTARAAGLAELSVERRSGWWISGRGLLRAMRSRTRGSLDIAAGIRTAIGELHAENRFHAQGGSEGSGAGLQDLVSVSLRRMNLPGGLTLGLRALGERSWAGEDSLRVLYDYRLFRPSVELGRRSRYTGDLTARTGVGRKWTRRDARGAYDGAWVEAEWMRWIGFANHAGLLVRHESRSYARSDSLTPSHRESRIEGRMEVSAPWRLRTSLHPRWSRTLYEFDSQVFQDNRSGEVLLRMEASLRDLAGRGDVLPGPEPDWNVSLGSRLGIRRSDRRHDSDYMSAGGLFGLSRDAGGRFWFDLTGEAGRRVYRVSGGSRNLVFEGLNISLSGTDYTYLNGTFIAETRLGAGFRCDIFGMYDQEFHVEPADDFALWSFNVSLTRVF